MQRPNKVTPKLFVHCELGADVNAAANSGYTLVFVAAGGGQIEAIRTLHELGADINLPNNEGCSPLLIAARNGDQDKVKLLHKLGADMNEESRFGSPAELAGSAGHPALAEKLVRYTSQCACCQKQGTTDIKLFACSRCKKTYYCSAAPIEPARWRHQKEGRKQDPHAVVPMYVCMYVCMYACMYVLCTATATKATNAPAAVILRLLWEHNTSACAASSPASGRWLLYRKGGGAVHYQ
jgi:hypothetical protein